MNEIMLSYKKIEHQYDVIVVGGGTAGVIAACAAGREGKRVLILEREFALGGTMTLSLTVPRMTNHIPHFLGNSSLAEELQRTMEQNDCAAEDYFASPQMLMLYLERMCAQYHVDILYGADLTGVVVEDRKIQMAVVNTTEGALGYCADAYIDCTGNAQLAVLSGCKTACGCDGANQPMTLRFAIGHVDEKKVEQTLHDWGYRFGGDHFPMEFYSLWREEAFNPLTKLLREGVNEGKLTERDGSYVQFFYHKTLGEDILWCNCPEAGHLRDAVSAQSVTQMVLYSRESAYRIHTFLKARFPGFENSYIMSFASIPGIRESRRIVGDFVLTEQDVAMRRRFADTVAQSAYPIDIHDEKNLVLMHMNLGEYYEIPYRCMLPDAVDNLLTAGRCLSASFAVQASTRIQLTCMALGEAAGIAAANSADVKKTDGAMVREKMISYGAKFI